MTAYTDFHYSPTGSGVISGAQVLEQTEQGINGLGQYVQDNVSGAIDTANQALTIAQTADSNATLALNTANSFASAISAANNTANNALTTAQSAQSTANAASSLATTANNNATSALNAANTASAGVTTLTGTVNSLGNRMTAAENAINANAGNITTLQNNLATTNANVTAASNAANAAQATATSAQATATLARNQAYVLRYTGTTITGGGTIAYADIDNTDNIKAGDKIIDISGAIYDIASVDTANQTVTVGASPVINLFCDAENLIPAANDAYDLGSSSYQWNNLYAKNYYYNGTEFQSKFVTTDTAQTVNGIKTFTAYVGSIGSSTGDEYSSNTRTNLWLMSNRDTQEVSGVLFDTYRQNTAQGTGIHILGISIKENSVRYEGCRWGWYWDNNLNGYTFDFKPTTQGANQALKHNLGTSNDKWDTLNGINPGALSFPDPNFSNIVDFSTTLNDITKETATASKFSWTATVTGWMTIIWYIKNLTPPHRVSIYATLSDHDGDLRYNIFATSFATGAPDYYLCSSFPAVAGVKYWFDTSFSNTSIGTVYHAYLLPCLGNV